MDRYYKVILLTIGLIMFGLFSGKGTTNYNNNSSKTVINTNDYKPRKLDLNNASKEEMTYNLYDIDEKTIDNIVKNRPYKLKTDLLNILDKATYKRVAYKLEVEG